MQAQIKAELVAALKIKIAEVPEELLNDEWACHVHYKCKQAYALSILVEIIKDDKDRSLKQILDETFDDKYDYCRETNRILSDIIWKKLEALDVAGCSCLEEKKTS